MKNQTFILLAVLLITGCGGGGGGGNHQSKQNYKNSKGLRLIHTALDGSPISAILDEQPLTTEPLPFNNISPFYSIKEGRHRLTIQEEGNGVQRRVYFDYKDGDRISILFAGNNLTTSAVLEVPSKSGKKDSTCPTTFIHGINDANTLEIMINGSSIGTIEPMSISSPVALEIGANQISIANGKGTTIWTETVTCRESENHSVVVSGQAGYFVTGNSVA